MLKYITLSVLVLALFTGCLKNQGSSYTCNTTYDPCAFKAPASEIQAVQDYLNANSITATQHCSGLFYAIDNPGSGATPSVCSDITAIYSGRLTNGTVFDSTSAAAGFNLGSVILGWANGIPLVKAGGTIRLYVPPTLAYGSTARGPIPANSILVFRVNLVSVSH